MSCGIKKLYETPYDMANNSHLIQEDFLNFPKELYKGDIFYTTKSEDISECEKIFINSNI